jgi:hypothetical protein
MITPRRYLGPFLAPVFLPGLLLSTARGENMPKVIHFGCIRSGANRPHGGDLITFAKQKGFLDEGFPKTGLSTTSRTLKNINAQTKLKYPK